ncbi:unnamed protein product, partial [marine sediment metagenome]
NLYTGGSFRGETDFDPGTGTDIHTGIITAYISKFNSNGDYQWVRVWGDDGHSGVSGIAFSSSGFICVGGGYEGTMDFDPGAGVDIHTPNGGYDLYVTLFDLDGNHLWTRAWGGDKSDSNCDVTIDNSDSIIASGYFQSTVDFDPGTGVDNHTSNGFYEAYIVKFDSNGFFVWAKSWGGDRDDKGYDVCTDNSDNILVSGIFGHMTMDSVDLDPGPGVDAHISVGSSDVSVSKFDTNGDLIWARSFGSNWSDHG